MSTAGPYCTNQTMTTSIQTKGRALVLAAITVLSMVAMASVAAPVVAQDSSNNIDSAERTMNGSTSNVTANPGDEVDITVTVTIGPNASENDAGFGFDEDFSPAFANVDTGFFEYNGEPQSDAIVLSENDFVSANIDRSDTPNGEYETGDTAKQPYTVTIPEDASDGDEFIITGIAQQGDDKISTTGPNKITVERTDETETPTPTPDDGTATATPDDGTATDDMLSEDGPGFGAIAALVAILSAALLARRRQ